MKGRRMTDKNDELIRRGAALVKIKKHSDVGREKLGAAYDLQDVSGYATWSSIVAHLDVVSDAIAALPAVQPKGILIPKRLVPELISWAQSEQQNWPMETAYQDDLAALIAALVVQPAPDAAPLSPPAVDASPAPDTDAKVAALVGAAVKRAIDACADEIDCGGCYGQCQDPANCHAKEASAIRALATDPAALERIIKGGPGNE
jgi:hypothetical protein